MCGDEEAARVGTTLVHRVIRGGLYKAKATFGDAIPDVAALIRTTLAAPKLGALRANAKSRPRLGGFAEPFREIYSMTSTIR